MSIIMKSFMMNALLTLPLLAVALPTPSIAGPGEITAEDIIKVAPATASCAGRGPQCVTAYQAAPAIANSFEKYGIVSFGSQAAVVSTILYESSNFEYDSPIDPVAGKGTRNMQSAEFNEKYASALGLASTGDTVALLNQDLDTSFGSAAWYLSSQRGPCPMSMRDEMHALNSAGYESYVINCLATGELADREQIWNSLLALKQW
ncbi:hypothetical protein EV356DRAFT_564273 [Viridothelium virens]|uniref:Uncharacterized protein n=1 Tax=Viridothelium virens TaxID=1048519 RepID=A0A6A6HJ60_VIRVR|nr:hypothetical protein EV356DRAFT_564273 [Viridothelium virens]